MTLLGKPRRNTSATKRRYDNMVILLDALRNADMTAEEFSTLLSFSPSGTRKYIRDLREAGAIELARYINGTATYLGQAVYCISPDEERVIKFLDDLRQPETKPAAPRPTTRKQQELGEGRSIHIMSDDTHYAVRVSRVIPIRSELDVYLFGEGPAPSIAFKAAQKAEEEANNG